MRSLILAVLFAGSAAEAKCVDRFDYPSVLTLSSVEAWASDSMISEGDSETECEMVRTLIKRFEILESTVAKASGGKRVRGTHAKGLCLNGTFTANYSQDLTQEKVDTLRQASVFANSVRRPAVIRFANGASKTDADYKADVRALSFKVDLGNGRTQDFSFNNVNRFQIPDLDSFVRVMDVVTGTMKGQIRTEGEKPYLLDLTLYLNNLYGPIRTANYLRKLQTVSSLKDHDVGFHRSYASSTYWSTTPFLVGEPKSVAPYSQIAQFGARPCGVRGAPLMTEAKAIEFANALVASGKAQSTQNYLSESLLNDLASQPICFEVFAEFLDEEFTFKRGNATRATELVENPSIAWRSRAHKVGRLEITSAADPALCEQKANSINVVRNQTGIQALGQINRARAFVEKASQEGRLK